MNARHRPLVLLVVAALLVTAAIWALPDPTVVEAGSAVDEASTQPATAGVWYCPPTQAEDPQATVVGAAPPTGNRPSRYTANRPGAPDLEAIAGELFPGAGFDLPLDDPTTALEVRWSDQPMVLSRVVRHQSDPAGIVAGPCTPSVSTTWFVPGLTTAAGATARLDITNPFPTEAAVAIEFLTGRGTEVPLAVQNLPVPAADSIHVDLNEVMPQREDLVARVTTRSGRVALSAVQQSVPTINGVRGRSLVTAISEADTTWHLPWVARVGDDDGGLGRANEEAPAEEETEPTEAPTDPEDVEVVVEGEADPRSWVWVANPSDQVAELGLALLSESGLAEPEPVTPLDVEPGSVLRIDLEPLLSELSGDIGAQVTATNDVPVVVSGGAVLATGAGSERTGLVSLAAHPRPDTSWTLTGPAGSERRQLLTVGNPTEDPARINVAAWTGVTSVRPADLQDMSVAPGQTLTVDLAERGLTGAAASTFVTTVEGQVTASLRSANREGPLAATVIDGVASRTWVSSGITTAVRREDGMVNRYGTELGIDVATPSPEPTPPPPGQFGEEGEVPSPGPGVSPGTAPDPGETPTPGQPVRPAPSPSPSPASSPTSTPTPTPTDG